jgi:hypothetical protein
MTSWERIVDNRKDRSSAPFHSLFIHRPYTRYPHRESPALPSTFMNLQRYPALTTMLTTIISLDKQ